MKLYLKSKATFGPNGYFRKAHTYLADSNYMNFWLKFKIHLFLSKVSWQCATSHLYKPFSFGFGVKHSAPTNKPTNNANSFYETATASTANLGINSWQTESKDDKHSRKSSGRTQG